MKKYLNFINESSFHPEYNVDIKKVDDYNLKTRYDDLEDVFDDWLVKPANNYNFKTIFNNEFFDLVKQCFKPKLDEIAEKYFIGGFEFEAYDTDNLIEMVKKNMEFFKKRGFHDIDLEDLEDDELIQLLIPLSEKIAKEIFKVDYKFKDDTLGYTYFSTFYNDEDFKEYIFHNLLSREDLKIQDIIDFDKLRKLLLNNLTFQEKYEWYVDDICDAETIIEEIIKYDKSNAIKLYKNCEDLCLKNYEVQKEMIKDLGENESLAERLKEINDNCGLDDKIAEEYSEDTYLISMDKFNI